MKNAIRSEGPPEEQASTDRSDPERVVTGQSLPAGLVCTLRGRTNLGQCRSSPGRVIWTKRGFLRAPVALTLPHASGIAEVVNAYPRVAHDTAAESAIVGHRSPSKHPYSLGTLEATSERFRLQHPNNRLGRLVRSDPSRPTQARRVGGGRIPSVVPSYQGGSISFPAVDAIRGIMSHPDGALKELHQEHEVAKRLLERLEEIGHRIKSGERVDAKTVRFGVGLLEAYVHRVHAFQMEDRELRSEAQGIAAPTLVEHLDRMGTNHAEMSRRTQGLLHLIGRWASGDESCRAAVGDGLIDLESMDHDAVTFEETYPHMSIESTLSEDADHRLLNRFADHVGTRGALEANIERFLSRTARI